jgi:hypothetical protein
MRVLSTTSAMDIQSASKWLERFQYAITDLKTQAKVSFPHGIKQQVFKFMRMLIPTPLFTLGLWRNTATMATAEQKAFCVLKFVKHELVVSVQRAFRRQFNSDPPPISQ